MSIQSEIDRIRDNVQSSLDVIRDAGVSVASNANSNDLPAAARALANGFLPLTGGTMTGPLKLSGGDAVTAGKIVLSSTYLGQITDTGTATLFGFTNSSNLTIGHSGYNTVIRGKASRPTYNGSNIALQSDIPTSHAASTITAGTFAGQVVANSSGQAYNASVLRNTKLVSSDTNPTVNGEICWTYK